MILKNNMETNPIKNIALVQAVEKYPELYNFAHPEYLNKGHREKIWDKIGTELNESGDICRDRWNNMRGNYSRAMKPCIKGNKKRYYLTEHMSFLLPFMKSIPMTENFDTVYDESKSENRKPRIKINKKKQNTSYCDMYENDEFDSGSVNNIKCEIGQSSSSKSSEEEITVNFSEIQGDNEFDSDPFSDDVKMEFEQSSENRKRKNSDEFSEVNDINVYDESILDDVESESHKSVIENADMHFFKSLLPELSKLEAKKKYHFKMEVMRLLHELIYE